MSLPSWIRDAEPRIPPKTVARVWSELPPNGNDASSEVSPRPPIYWACARRRTDGEAGGVIGRPTTALSYRSCPNWNCEAPGRCASAVAAHRPPGRLASSERQAGLLNGKLDIFERFDADRARSYACRSHRRCIADIIPPCFARPEPAVPTETMSCSLLHVDSASASCTPQPKHFRNVRLCRGNRPAFRTTQSDCLAEAIRSRLASLLARKGGGRRC